jgi:hypothetical protein
VREQAGRERSCRPAHARARRSGGCNRCHQCCWRGCRPGGLATGASSSPSCRCGCRRFFPTSLLHSSRPDSVPLVGWACHPWTHRSPPPRSFRANSPSSPAPLPLPTPDDATTAADALAAAKAEAASVEKRARRLSPGSESAVVLMLLLAVLPRRSNSSPPIGRQSPPSLRTSRRQGGKRGTLDN